MLKRVYFEITNLCNLRCSFCHGTTRPTGFISAECFERLAKKLQGHTSFLYFHLMGEPLLHPALPELLEIAHRLGFRVNLTTNGTLLAECAPVLLSAPGLHRVNISLQSWEANSNMPPLFDYINQCAAFSRSAAAGGILVSLRLWNGGGDNARNDEICSILAHSFPGPWHTAQKNTVLANRVFLEYGDCFDWPDLSAADSGTRFCHGLRDHIGILWDGTVVPCCLDADGVLALGNLNDSTLEGILESPRARAIYEGFSRREAVEPMCRRCGYSARF